ncbi:hypothetical protein DVH24_033469 [Malus domestica]|uniref:E3 ubiquitin protein ligase n=1 Tax=Malus domestica TaxID=3750 RepID=A0A498JFG0_MALDO|nr:hypothetical protein DVH24_033469 [Malus domestica]
MTNMYFLNDQFQHWNAELDQYKALTDYLQLRMLVRNAIDNSESRIEELELQLQKCLVALKMLFVAGRKDIIAEFRVMASSLCKEMGMVETQLKRWKETAYETLSLRDKAQSLKALLSTKVYFHSQLTLSYSYQLHCSFFYLFSWM